MEKELKLMFTGDNLSFGYWLEWLQTRWASYAPVEMKLFYSRRIEQS